MGAARSAGGSAASLAVVVALLLFAHHGLLLALGLFEASHEAALFLGLRAFSRIWARTRSSLIT